MSRSFDHVVLPVADLVVARQRYEALGFTVAPDGIHPFGTANCCIFLRRGGFLEPLALHDAARRDATLWSGDNAAFVDGHRRYVEAVGAEGFSHLVFRSLDARSDREHFQAQNIFCGRTQFKRIAANDAGESQEVSFDLTFATDTRSPDAGFFTCQSLTPLGIDFSELRTHRNAVAGLSAVHTVALDPGSHGQFLEALTDQLASTTQHSLAFDLGPVQWPAHWTVQTPKALADYLGADAAIFRPLSEGLQHMALSFASTDFNVTLEALAEADIPAQTLADRIVVPPGPGQGYWMVFEPDG
ncbi:MAG: VOC family protein [Pseudomonadota bacterium]